MKTLFIFIYSLISLTYISAQDTDPNLILKKVRDKTDRIHDYQANAEIRVDVDFIRMPVKHAVVYYKQPDKIRFKSDEFIMLPNQGFDFSLGKLLKEDYTAVLTGTDTLGGKENYIIRIIPLKQGSDIVLSTLWVDRETYRIRKTESTTRSGGTYGVDFSYDKQDDILPVEMKISFEIQGMDIPSKFIGNMEEPDTGKINAQNRKTGAVYITFSNYRINKGIDDKVFTEEN
jgi:outer membrane lipoprotein-sorting protein